MGEKRKGYPSDVSDEEWNFCVNYLTLMKENAPQREHSLRSVFNALRYLIRVGGAYTRDKPKRHRAIGGQTPSSQTGFCVVTASLGGGTILRLVGPFSATGTRL